MNGEQSHPSIADFLSTMSLDQLPGEWKGGEAQNIGDDIYLREFLNRNESLRVSYYVNDTSKGVNLERIVYDGEDEETISGEVIAADESATSDFEKFTVAHGMMAGTYALTNG